MTESRTPIWMWLLLGAWLTGNVVLFALDGTGRFARDAVIAESEAEVAQRRAVILAGQNKDLLKAFSDLVSGLHERGYERVLMLAGKRTNPLTSTAFHLAYPVQIVIQDPEKLTTTVKEAIATRGFDAALVPGNGGRWRIVERG